MVGLPHLEPPNVGGNGSAVGTGVHPGDLQGDVDQDGTARAHLVLNRLGLIRVNEVEPGTVVAGRNGTGEATSYMVVDKGSKSL